MAMFRSLKELEERMIDLKLFCKRMPKCEFNVRWEACVNKSMLRTLEEQRRFWGKPELTIAQRKLLWAYGEPRNMKEALKAMSVVYDMIGLQEQVFTITLDIIKFYHADNVVYLELHAKPRVSNELSPEIFLRKMIQAISYARSTQNLSMTVKVLLVAELEESIDRVREAFDLLLIFGKTRRNQNAPDGDIIHGVEIVFVETSRNDILQLKKMIEFIRRESDLVIVFNLSKIGNNVNFLHEILLLHPNRICNAKILYDLDRTQTVIDRHILTDRLLSMKSPIEFSYTATRLSIPDDKKPIWMNYFFRLLSLKYPIILTTGYSILLGCTLSDEYYQLAINMDLKPNDIYQLSLTASFFTEKTPCNHRHHLFPFVHKYDKFAKIYSLNNSIEYKLRILRDCQFFLSRPLTNKRRRRRRKIIDILNF